MFNIEEHVAVKSLESPSWTRRRRDEIRDKMAATFLKSSQLLERGSVICSNANNNRLTLGSPARLL